MIMYKWLESLEDRNRRCLKHKKLSGRGKDANHYIYAHEL